MLGLRLVLIAVLNCINDIEFGFYCIFLSLQMIQISGAVVMKKKVNILMSKKNVQMEKGLSGALSFEKCF